MYKLLIVDDEKFIRKRLVEHCPWNEWGFECVAESKNGMEALQKFSDYYPDVVLTDLRMPIMNGIDFIKKLRKRNVNCPIVISSGYADFNYAQQAIGLDVIAYLLKPIKQTALEDAFSSVKKILDEGRNIKEISRILGNIELEPIISYIEVNYSEEIKVQQLADMAHLSISQLSRKFKKETGICIISYIKKTRIEKAKLLLKHTQMKIYEIAQNVGYFDTQYFCRVFREITNCSPTEYRK